MEKLIIPCWNCGEPATETISFFDDFGTEIKPVSPFYRCYCSKCKEEVERKEQEEYELYIRLKKMMMFRKACYLLEKQGTQMYEYQEAIEVVREHIENNPDKYDSSYEALAAIVLVQNRIYTKMQHKIGKYQVDFFLPDLMVVLEIDGDRHKHHGKRDLKRDLYIKRVLGDGWDIVRIKTEYLDQDAKKLPEAIYKIIEYRETGHIDWRNLYGNDN